MTCILGIDPGSRITGYGVIRVEGQRHIYLASGCIRVESAEIEQKLLQIFSGVKEIIAKYNPTESAIEQIFMHRNANSALKLGEARGVAIAALGEAGLTVGQYSARQVKQSVVGYGAAQKDQVQHMVMKLLNLSAKPAADAADALAIALCHAQVRISLARIEAAKQKDAMR